VDGLVVFADICSILEWEGRSLQTDRLTGKKPLLVVILLLVCAALLPASGMGPGASTESVFGGNPEIKQQAEEELERARNLIAEKRYDEAAQVLAGVGFLDQEFVEEMERLFTQIRTAREEYLARGEEVRDRIQEIVSGDLTTEEVLPRAVEALGLIDAMEEIIPFPNERDLEIRTDLRYTVQLNLDIRIFAENMDAARERLAAEDYAGAAEIYVNGDPDVIERLLSSLDQGEELQVTLENGVDIQRPAFEIRDYDELFKTGVSTSREAIRRVGNEFAATSPAALAEAARLTAAFETGDFADVESQIDDYLQVLATVTQFASDVAESGGVIEEANAFVETRRAEDAGFRLDWHMAFLQDIVYGRDEFEDEGLLYTVNTVRSIVEGEPIAAVRSFGDERYSLGRELLDGIAWPETATGSELAPVTDVIARADAVFPEATLAYRTLLQILSTSRQLGLVVPEAPAEIGAVDDALRRAEWASYLDSVAGLIEEAGALPDEALAGTLTSSALLAASANEIRVTAQRAGEGLGVAVTRRTTATALAAQRSGVLAVLGDLDDPAIGTLRELGSRWDEFRAATSNAPGRDEFADEAVLFTGSYASLRIEDLERYERNIVEEISGLEYNALNSRVASLRTRTNTAERQVDGITETVTSRDEDGNIVRDASGAAVTFQAVRRYPGRARDTLVPMVGRISGTRIVSTTGGEFAGFLDDAAEFISRYRGEVPYVAESAEIRSDIARAEGLITTVGLVTEPALFGRARDVLERALALIAEAEDLEGQGAERVAAIGDLLDAAAAANDAGDPVAAGENLAQAERLLKSDDVRIEDASDLYTASLELWYRSTLESEWNRIQSELNSQIAQAQADIVITRVQQAVVSAEPLVDEQQWQDALILLDDADQLWNSVFPTTTYPPLVRLLRFVETALAKQNERVLREDDPDYDKLAPLLSRASQALTEGIYDEASRLLEQFLRAQPNNLEARLLEVDIALESEEGAVATKIDRLITGALPEDVARSEIDELDAADALELQSLLIAILDRLGQRTDVSQAAITRIENEVETLELVLSPPRIVVATPDLRAESNALVDRALARGALQSLSRADLQSAIDLLEQALEVDPTNPRAIESLSFALRLPSAPTRTALDATEQQIFKQARDAFARGNVVQALTLVEQLWASPDNRLDTELNQFRQEVQDAITRG
jgi:tetratricopeptide (TPR) repeat protein